MLRGAAVPTVAEQFGHSPAPPPPTQDNPEEISLTDDEEEQEETRQAAATAEESEECFVKWGVGPLSAQPLVQTLFKCHHSALLCVD